MDGALDEAPVAENSTPSFLIPSLNIHFTQQVETVTFNAVSACEVAAGLTNGNVAVIDLMDPSKYQNIRNTQNDSHFSNFGPHPPPCTFVGTSSSKVCTAPSAFDISAAPSAYQNKSKNSIQNANVVRKTNSEKCVPASSPETSYKPTKLHWHSHSNTLLGVAYINGSIQLLDTRMQYPHTKWKAHEGMCSDFKFLPSCKYTHTCLSSGSMDGYMYMWDIRQCGKVLHAIQFKNGVSSVGVTRDASVVCVANVNGDVQIMNLPLLQPFVHIGYRPTSCSLNSYSHAEFSKNGRCIMLTGVEETTSGMQEATGIHSTPVCEVWDLQNPYYWCQMRNTASVWKYIRKTKPHKAKTHNADNFNVDGCKQPLGKEFPESTHATLCTSVAPMSVEMPSGIGDEAHGASSLQQLLLESTCWKAFPRSIAFNQSNAFPTVSEKRTFLPARNDSFSAPYILYENTFNPLLPCASSNRKPVYEGKFFDSSDEDTPTLPSQPIKEQKALKRDGYNETSSSEIHSAFVSAAYTSDEKMGEDPNYYRLFQCCFLGDMVVGVGGPQHFCGAMKLWDAMSGFMQSATITAESQGKITSIVSHPLDGPFLLSSGWDSLINMGRITLWNYVSIDQMKLFGLVE